ncbi:MAG TPA: sigma-54 dependent transcriptional regulator [bacterium]|nr:sigma-54 dependent transcriptional regulator [bacterium]
MQTFRPAILYVDDEEANLKAFKRAFGEDYLVKTCLSAADALNLLENEEFPLIIADQRMPGMTGIELCERLVTLKPQTVRMILTAYTEADLLLSAINRGHVHDYLVKPWRKAEIQPAIDRAFDDYKQRAAKLNELREKAVRAEALEAEVKEIYDFEGMIGSSSGLKGVSEIVRKAAVADATVLILGETGTGKELVARALHAASRRAPGPFVPVHCAALAANLLESELFGHEKGSFTGAEQARPGRFEAAAGGTIFLDEVGEIPEAIQVKLLRVLQEKEVQRVGGNKTLPVDVRVVAATNRDLKREMAAGRFREDLFFRLNVVPIHVPPLRERMADVPHLANFFLQKFNRQLGRSLVFDVEAVHHLGRYDWPGNVRELQNIVERAAILSGGPALTAEDLRLDAERIMGPETVEIASVPASTVRDEIRLEESRRLSEALRRARGSVSEAARFLGIARSTLFDRLKKHRLV